MSSNPTYDKSSLSSKVNSFLYKISFHAPLDGILREHLPLCYARFDTTSTDVKADAEEAQDSRPSKAYAWKRKRKDREEDEVSGRRFNHRFKIRFNQLRQVQTVGTTQGHIGPTAGSTASIARPVFKENNYFY